MRSHPLLFVFHLALSIVPRDAAFPTASGVNPMITTQTMAYYLAYNFIRPRLQQLCGLSNQQQQQQNASQSAGATTTAVGGAVRPNL